MTTNEFSMEQQYPHVDEIKTLDNHAQFNEAARQTASNL